MNAIRRKIPKDYRPMVAAAEAQGWVLSQGRGDHPKLTAPDGFATPIPTSSSHRGLVIAIRNRLRAHGIEDL